jgi:hypothetical protein
LYYASTGSRTGPSNGRGRTAPAPVGSYATQPSQLPPSQNPISHFVTPCALVMLTEYDPTCEETRTIATGARMPQGQERTKVSGASSGCRGSGALATCRLGSNSSRGRRTHIRRAVPEACGSHIGSSRAHAGGRGHAGVREQRGTEGGDKSQGRRSHRAGQKNKQTDTQTHRHTVR